MDGGKSRTGQILTGSVVNSLKEESSDESTIISSQTSTLTRNQGPEDMDSDDGDVEDRMGENDDEEDEEDDGEQDQFQVSWGANQSLMSFSYVIY